MKILFFGSDNFSLPILRSLLKEWPVVVVTQPDAPSGRGQALKPNPVAEFCQENRLRFFKFEKLNEESLAKLDRATIGICCVYGKVIPQAWLNAFEPKGILNIHPSLLPQYRGASPGQAALLNGDQETGVTVFKMDQKVDHGPIVTQLKEKILIEDNAESLYNRLFNLAGEKNNEIIKQYLKNPKVLAQDHQSASYTSRLERQDGFIDWLSLKELMAGKKIKELPVLKKFPLKGKVEMKNLFQALMPWPGVFTFLKLRPWQSSLPFSEKRLKILSFSFQGSSLALGQVQLEGKKPISFAQLETGYEFS